MARSHRILGIETSCDETGVAVYDTAAGLLGHALHSQVAMHQGATVHVLTRSEVARRHALDLGCASAGAADDVPPEPLDAAILFAPAGELVPVALAALDAAVAAADPTDRILVFGSFLTVGGVLQHGIAGRLSAQSPPD